MDYKKCTIETTDSCIVVRENKSKFELHNPSRLTVQKIKVDGCLFTDYDEIERCDWIVKYDLPEKTIMYIELKGCNLDKAITQLVSTLSRTKSHFSDYRKNCFAITTRVPKHDTSARKHAIDMKKKFDATLLVKNFIAIVTI